MIYEMYLDGELLYYQGDEERMVANAVLKQSLDESDTLEFDIYKTHPLYDDFKPRNSMIQVLKDGKEAFYGEVREVIDNLDFSRHIYAVGELAFLFDSIQPQAKYQDISPLEFFRQLVNIHNSQVEDKKKFTVGMVTVTDPNNSLYRFTNYEDTLSALRDKLCDRLEGFLRIRKANGVRYLDLVKIVDYGVYCNQAIEFGENLLEYSCNTSAQDIATALIPLGARQDESVIEGLDAYLTIESVNGGKDYIYNENAVNNFGMVKVVKHWDDITLPSNLLKAGENWLSSAQYEQMTLELNAVDLSALDVDLDSIEVGDRVNAIAEPFGMDTVFPLQKKVTYLQDPSKNYITLGNTIQKSYTQQASKAVTEIKEEMPQQNSILQIAKENATAMLTGANGGYVLFGMNDDGQIEELFITDNLDKTKAQRIWRWNLNGLGYSSTGMDGTYGLAITANGAIVADFITTGVMSADRIEGGTLKLGYYNNKDGVLEIYDSSGAVIGKWDKSGITVEQGAINANVINAGVLKDRKTGNIFYLDLDNGVLRANFNSLSISGYSAATEKYADDGDSDTLDAANEAAKGYASNAVKNQTQEDIFNKLTNNKKVQAIVLDNGNIYINASYINAGTLSGDRIQGGTLTLGGKDNGNGKLVIKDASGKTIGQWNNGGLSVNKGTISGSTISGSTFKSSDGGSSVDIHGGMVKVNVAGSGERYVTIIENGKTTRLGGENVSCESGDWYVQSSWYDVIQRDGSDIRLKDNLEDLNLELSKELILHSKPYSFNYKDRPKLLSFGLIAQEVKEQLENFGLTDEDTLLLKKTTGLSKESEWQYILDYKQYVPHLINVVQEQQKEIEALKSELQIIKEIILTERRG